jgi:saccharopine dehydrogenase (NAD+, L-lysine-forming)
MYIACHFWDEKSPHFITKEDMKDDDFKLKVIADVSCDIDGPIASTIRASEIADPFYGYNPVTEEEGDAFDETNITVMAVDNLPGEVPRDASVDFGNDLIENVFPSLFDGYEVK